MIDAGRPFDRDASAAACVRLVAGFAYLVDQRRYDELADLFTDDGVFERPGTRAQGRAGILAFMAARPETMDTRHVCSVPFFEELTADRASLRTYVTMFHGQADPQGGPTAVAGSAGVVEFHDICVRAADGWRILHHKSHVAMVRA
jgi:SnoaL-like domain